MKGARQVLDGSTAQQFEKVAPVWEKTGAVGEEITASRLPGESGRGERLIAKSTF